MLRKERKPKSKGAHEIVILEMETNFRFIEK